MLVKIIQKHSILNVINAIKNGTKMKCPNCKQHVNFDSLVEELEHKIDILDVSNRELGKQIQIYDNILKDIQIRTHDRK